MKESTWAVLISSLFAIMFIITQKEIFFLTQIMMIGVAFIAGAIENK